MTLKRGVALLLLTCAGGVGAMLCRQARRTIAVRVIQTPSGMTSSGEFQGASAPLRLRRLYSVGTPDGSSRRAFDIITAAVMDSSGRLYVLDAVKHRLSMFSPAGRLLARTGHKGSAAGEFIIPQALAISSGHIYVLDSGRKRVIAFRIGARSLALDREIPLGMPAYDVCAMGRHLYVLGLSADALIHEIRPDGSLVRSFAKPHAGPHLLALVLARGRIACDPASGRVALVSSVLPTVRFYSAKGARLWATSLQNFHGMRITLRGRGVGYQMVDGYSDMALEAVVVEGCCLAVQVGAVSSEVPAPEEVQKVTTEWLTLGSGREAWQNRNLPRVMDAENGKWVAFSNVPYPHVDVFTYSLNARPTTMR